MAILFSPTLNEQQFDANGDPLAGGFIYTYLAGTTTPVTTYKTSTGTAHSNPIALDSAGYYPTGTQLWLDSGKTYKFVVQNSLGSTIRTYDNIVAINDDTESQRTEWIEYITGPATFISGTSFSVVGDQTLTFQIGRRLKSENTSGTIYSTITNSVYGAPNTTVTVVNDSGALDSGLSTLLYGILSPQNPSLAQLNGNLSVLTLDLGNNADTTITRSAAGQIAVEGSLVYQRNNIVGTVSQSAGVPTGAVIERGSNANGEYTRWADGTQICTSQALSMTSNTGSGAVFTDGAPPTWTYPAAFSAEPKISGNVIRTSGSGPGWLGNYSSVPTNTTYQPRLISALTGYVADVRVIATGRWF